MINSIEYILEKKFSLHIKIEMKTLAMPMPDLKLTRRVIWTKTTPIYEFVYQWHVHKIDFCESCNAIRTRRAATGCRVGVELRRGRRTVPAAEADHSGGADRQPGADGTENAGKQAAAGAGSGRERAENVAGSEAARGEERAHRRGGVPPPVGLPDARAAEPVVSLAQHARPVPEERQPVAGRGREQVVGGQPPEAVAVGAPDGPGRQVLRR